MGIDTIGGVGLIQGQLRGQLPKEARELVSLCVPSAEELKGEAKQTEGGRGEPAAR